MTSLPPPEVLKKYQEIHPAVVSAITMMARNEQDHRHRMDERILRAYTSGYWVSHLITLSSAATGIYLMLTIGVWPAVVLIPVGLTPSLISLLLKKLSLSE